MIFTPDLIFQRAAGLVERELQLLEELDDGWIVRLASKPKTRHSIC